MIETWTKVKVGILPVHPLKPPRSNQERSTVNLIFVMSLIRTSNHMVESQVTQQQTC